MTVAKLAYITFAAPGVFIFNFQIGDGELQRVEISRGHVANILIDCTSVALREYSQNEGKKNDRDAGRQFEGADQVNNRAG